MCPGRWLSDASLFMTIASALHTLEILTVAQEDGQMYDPSTVIVEGIVLCVVIDYVTFVTL